MISRLNIINGRKIKILFVVLFRIEVMKIKSKPDSVRLRLNFYVK